MLSSIEQHMSNQTSNQTLRLVDRDRLIPQRVRVKPNEKLICKETETSQLQQNLLENFCELSCDFDLNPTLNNVDLFDLDSQMSSLFHQEEGKTYASNYKTIKGLGFYSCDTCPFLCLNGELFSNHFEETYHSHHAPLKSLLRTKCIGCENIFYSRNVLRFHLVEDHNVLSVEVDQLIQLIAEANKADIPYINEEISQTENNNLVNLNDINDSILDTSELKQKLNVFDTFTQQTIEENNFMGNCRSNESTDDIWAYQEQASNGLQESNTNINDSNESNTEINDSNKSNTNNIIEKRIKCTFKTCKVRFGKVEYLKYHTQFHSDHGFRCIESECQYISTKWSSMITHLWKTHTIDIEMYSCNQCEFKTNSLYKLNTFHINIHKQEKPFMCSICNKGFKSIKQLRNHKDIHTKTKKPPKPDLTCLHCNRNFSSKNILFQHITSVHIRVRPYSCNVCGFATAVASSLTLHKRSHTGEKPFVCDHCGFSTSDHNTLRKHKKRHTGQKDYSCPLCDYSCIQASTYKKHLNNKHPEQVTDDGYIYSCNLCNFKTIRNDLYLLHIVKHKEETIQKNDICEPIIGLDELLKEEEKIQSEINDQSLLYNIRVKPLNTMKPDERVEYK